MNFEIQRDAHWPPLLCERRKTASKHSPTGRLIFHPPHSHPAIGRWDESNERNFNFSLATARYLKEECDEVETVNYFELTNTINPLLCRSACAFNRSFEGYQHQKECGFRMVDTCQDAKFVTPDGFHYGSAVNFMKAQILLAYLSTVAPRAHLEQ